jgi:TfoX/Sxy family transcriptional regulator of competence genes
MAYDERLAERIRGVLQGRGNVTERKMFGGIAFMVDGKMAVGVLGDEIVVRTGKDRYDAALNDREARPMDFTGRPSRGMVYVSSAGVRRGPALLRWIDLGIAAAREAPASRVPGTKKRARKRAPKRSPA